MKQNLLNKLWLRVGMIVAIMTTALSGTVWAETTYKLQQVTSVEAGGLYVFEQSSRVMNNTCASYALQTTDSYSTSGLTGTETYVWTLETATGGYYMKNVNGTGLSPYLNNASSTSVSFGTKSSIWAFNFQTDGTVLIQNTSNQSRFLGYTTSTSYAYKAYAASNLSLYPHAIKVYKLVEESGGTSTCAAPTFSPAAGAVVSGTEVTISSPDGATIYYTTDGTTPTSSSSVYFTPIKITEATTIKAFASKSGYNDSDIATATYTIKPTVSGYTIDFENDVDDYVDWTFINAEQAANGANTNISAHGGTHYGTTGGKATASIQTKTMIALPGTFTCYISKQSNNTTTSTWYIQVSLDGSTWTDVETHSATSMNAGIWTEFTANLSSYSNVYVRLYYSGSTAIRNIDDISITMRDPNVVVPPSISGTTPFLGSTEVTITAEEGATIYYTTDGSDPTTSSTQYNAPFTISATTTVKAIAVKDSKTSEVASKEFEKTASYTIDELYALEDGTYYVQFENASVTYINGSYTYIEDANGGLLYYKSNNGLSVGQVLNGFASVAWKIYSGQPEATSITGLEATTGEAPAPTTMTLAALVANPTSNMSRYVKLESVVAASTADGFKLTQGESEIAFYGRNSAAVEDGKTYDVIGFLGKHNDNYQFMVFSLDHITEIGVEKSETPTIAVTGDESKTVTITAATGATIYYTTDGTTPTEESEVYTSVLTFTTPGNYTIKAVALEEGKALSTVATETFSINAPAYISLAAGESVTTSFPSFSGSGYHTFTDYMISLSNGSVNAWSVTDGMKSGDGLQLKASSGCLVSPEICTPNGYIVTVDYTSATDMTLTSGELTATGTTVDEELGTQAVSLTIESTAAAFTLAVGSKYAVINSITITAIAPYTPSTISLNGSGYATFASTSAVDFTNAEANGYSAWAVTAVSGTEITFSQITGAVKAGTGVLLKGAASDTVEPVYVSSGEEVANNKLVGIITPTAIEVDQYYGLSGQSFVKVKAGTVKAGKALLPASVVNGTEVKTLTFFFEEDDPTGVNDLNVDINLNSVIYNVSGQRLNKMQKGINIVNGKKVIKQ